MPRVVILYNEPTLQADHPDALSEHEIVYTVGAVEEVLKKADYDVQRLGAHVDPGPMITKLQKLKPDVVFNLFEGLPLMGQTEAFAAGILEWLGIPYTGCGFQSMVLARNKPLAKRLFRDALLPTPKFRLIEEMPPKMNRMGWPVIVKPSNQDASVGMDQSSVVTNAKEFEQRVEKVWADYGGPVLVEEFIPGREISLMLFEQPELQPLVFWEVKFTDKDPKYWPIITYDAKWKPGTRDYEATPIDYSPTISPRLRAKLERIGKKAFRLIGCRDIARVDFRVTPEEDPFILEMNPNPDFSPMAGLSEGLGAAGTSHSDMTLQLVKNALARGAQKLEVPKNVKVIEWE